MRLKKWLICFLAFILASQGCRPQPAEPSPSEAQVTPSALQPEPTPESLPPTARKTPQSVEESIEKWTELGVISAESGMEPDAPVRTADLVSALGRIIVYFPYRQAEYEDVSETDWYYEAVMAAGAAGVLDGGAAARPLEALTCFEAAGILARTLGMPGDGALEAAEAGDYMTLHMLGYLASTEKADLDAVMTRAQLLAVLDGLINDIVTESATLSGTYDQSVVIKSGSVKLSGAQIKGRVYFLPGEAGSGLEITDSILENGILAGSPDDRAFTLSMDIDSSVVGDVCVNGACALSLGGVADSLYFGGQADVALSGNAVVGSLVAADPVSVTGEGRIKKAAVLKGAGGASFVSAPELYVDVDAGICTGAGEPGPVSVGKYTFCADGGGALVFGFAEFDGASCYFGADGLMYTGYLELENGTYHFQPDGRMTVGWHEDGGMRYFGTDGVMAEGFAQIDGALYCFDDGGVLESGMFLLSDGYHLAAANGKIAAGLIEFNGETYLTDEYGLLLTGRRTVDGVERLFDAETGAMLKDGSFGDYTVDPDGIIVGSRISTGDAELDEKLDEIVAGITNDDMSLDEKMFAVYYWTYTNIRYRATPIDLLNGFTQELVSQHTENTIDTRRGACEHFAMVNATLFNRLGVETILIEGYRYSTYYGTWDEHTWVLANIDGEWYHYDALYEYQHTGTQRSCFMKTDSDFQSHHTWDRDAYPVCGG